MPRPRSERRSAWPAVVLAVALPMIYVLSAGPAHWLLSKPWVDERIWICGQYLYAPLFWLAHFVPRFETAVGWYLDLWA